MKRPFCIIGGAYLISAFAASYMSISMQVMGIITCIFAILFCLMYVEKTRKSFVVCACVAAILAMGQMTVKEFNTQDLTKQLDGVTMRLTGTVTEITPRSNHRYTYYLDVDGENNPTGRSFKTILYSNTYLDADYYDQVTLSVSCYVPTDTETFDSVRYYKSKNVVILSYFDEGTVKVKESKQKPVLYFIRTLNDKLCTRIDERMPGKEAAVVKSIILGQQEDLDFTLREQYIKAGAVHLFAISGVHISILAGFLALVFRIFRRNGKLQIVLQMAIVGGFIVLSGARISAIRAGLMVLLLYLGHLFERKPESLNSLCFAGFLIVLCNIYAIMDIGFLMSFSATLGIILGNKPATNWVIRKTGISDSYAVRILKVLVISLCANVFLLPVYVVFYQSMSLVFLPVNVLTNVTGTLSIVLGFLLMLFLLFPVSILTTAPLCFLETWIVRIQNVIVSFFGELPFATVGLDYEMLQLSFLMCLLILGVVLLYRKRQNLIKPGIALCLIVLFLGNIVSMGMQSNQIEIAIIGDGRTSNVVLLYNRFATVISPYDDDYIDEQTYRFLKSRGVRKIDHLLLMYHELNWYQDTLRLVDNMPTSSILYNYSLGASSNLLAGYSDSLLPMGEGGGIFINEEIQITFSYYKEILNLELNCRGVSICLTNYVPTLQEAEADISLVRGNVYDDLVELNSEYVVLLQRQWDAVYTDTQYHNASQKSIEFVIDKEGTLSCKEDE